MGGAEHILLVDDETMLVDMERLFLERIGYRVTTRTDSREALELFRSAPARFDLVITDQTMPHLTGIELVRELLKIRPDLPVILCSGFSGELAETRLEELGVRRFLMKPFIIPSPPGHPGSAGRTG
jgi:CheY-like chemotaxis protein